jgi:hypothetical protein
MFSYCFHLPLPAKSEAARMLHRAYHASLARSQFGVTRLYIFVSDLDLHAVERCDGPRKNLSCGFLGKFPVVERGVKTGVKVDEIKLLGARFHGDPRGGLGIQVRPALDDLSRPVRAFSDKQISLRAKSKCVLAIARVRAIRNNLPIDTKPISKSEGGVPKGQCFDVERQFIYFSRKLKDLGTVFKLVKRHGVRLFDECGEDFFRPFRTADHEPLFELELSQDVKARNVVQMEMTQENEHGLPAGDIAVELVDAVSRIENDVVLFGLDQDTDRITGCSVVPAVSA